MYFLEEALMLVGAATVAKWIYQLGKSAGKNDDN